MGLNTSPISVKTTIPDFKKKGAELKKAFRQYIRETHKEIIDMAKNTLMECIRITDAVASQTLLKSVSAKAVANKSSDGYLADLGFKKPASEYAYFANYGRDAGGNPPYFRAYPQSGIAKWAKSKGIDSKAVWAIIKHIGEYGTEGHFFMEKAQPIIKRNMSTILKQRTDLFKRTYK